MDIRIRHNKPRGTEEQTVQLASVFERLLTTKEQATD